MMQYELYRAGQDTSIQTHYRGCKNTVNVITCASAITATRPKNIIILVQASKLEAAVPSSGNI
ncbi:MAG: hypothetical protein JOY71_01445 [Acetobacteraceae bacterium]|nr:hypothetical protein [Acetobacteraceae bacterium]MBV8520793.1 hypothetical protein [Acetobacteraceae bacterium]